MYQKLDHDGELRWRAACRTALTASVTRTS
jgi:hypothetical protein